jgi:uncharacterized protein YggE
MSNGITRSISEHGEVHIVTKRDALILALAALVVMATAVTLTSCTGTPAMAGGGPLTAESSPALQPGDEPPSRSLSVNGVGMASAQPDLALIQLGAESIDGDPGRAISDNAQRMTAVMDVLKRMELAEQDIQTVNYSMWIEQVHDRDGQPTGETRYHVVNQVRVRLRDLSRAGEVVQQALDAGANSLGGVTFAVADPAALQRQARDRAIADAKARAEQLASGLGARLGLLRQVSEYGGIVGSAVPEAYGGGIGGGSAVPVSGGEFSVTVEIQVVFDIAE